MHLKTVLRKFAALGVGHVIAKAVAFTAAILLARKLSAQALGIYAIVLTALGYMQAVTTWGTDALGIRSVARETSQAAAVAVGVLKVRAAIGAVIVGLITVASVWLKLSPHIVVGLSLCLAALVLRRDWLLLARGDAAKVGLALGVREALFLCLILVAVPLFPHLETAIWALVIAELGWTGTTVLLARRDGAHDRTVSARSLVIEGLPIALVSVTVLTNNKVDVPLLGYFRSAPEVASYWGAYNVLFAAMAMAALLTRAALPEMSRQARDDREHGSGSSFHIAVLSGITGCIGAIVLASLSDPVIRLLYAGHLPLGGGALKVLALSLPAHFLGAILVGRLVAEGRQRQWTIAAVAAAATNVCLNLVLIPKHGIIGAAWATVASESVLLFLVLFAFRSHAKHRALVLNAGAIAVAVLLGAVALRGNGFIGLFIWVTLALGGLVVVASQKVPVAMRLAPLRGES